MTSWYDESAQAIRRLYGSDSTLFTACLVATSPNTKLDANVTLARKLYHYIRAGAHVPTTHFIRTHVSQIEHYLSHGSFSGTKCQSFFRALTGDTNAIVVDIWILRHYGHKYPTPSALRDISCRITQESALAGMTPRDYQAKVWAKERGSSTSYATYLAQWSLL